MINSRINTRPVQFNVSVNGARLGGNATPAAATNRAAATAQAAAPKAGDRITNIPLTVDRFTPPANQQPGDSQQVMGAVGQLLQAIASLLQNLLQKFSGQGGAGGVADGSSAATGADASAATASSSDASSVADGSSADSSSAAESAASSPAPAPAPQQDQSAAIAQNFAIAHAMGWIDPLAMDTSGKGIHATGEKVKFDMDGDGKKETVNNLDAGMLAIRGGKDGKDLLGNFTDIDGDGKSEKYKDGFSALEALARKEGLVNDKGDTKLDKNDLALLEKKYGLGIKQGYTGEKKSLESAGITEIDLGHGANRKSQLLDDGGDVLAKRDGASFKMNGQQRSYGDVWANIKG